MPSTIGKCKLFGIKQTFLRNKHENAFFEIKCTFFGGKEYIITVNEAVFFFYQIEKAVIALNSIVTVMTVMMFPFYQKMCTSFQKMQKCI